MNKKVKVAIVVALIIAVGVVIALKQTKRPSKPVDVAYQSIPERPEALPRLVDVGKGTCIPCKMMAPILEDLKSEYAGRFHVEVIDLRENPNATLEYGIQILPTQIFYDTSRAELFRHEGFMSKEDILAKWKELGISLGTPTTTQD